MSVELLSHDAKLLIEQHVVEMQEGIQGFHEGFQKKSGFEYGSHEHQEALKLLLPQDLEKNLAEYETWSQRMATWSSSIKELQAWLEKPEFWQKTTDEAHNINYPPGWGKAVFKKEIKGFVILCCNAFFEVRGLYSKEDAELLVREKIRKSKSKVNYLKFRQETPEAELEYERQPIPEAVRNEVWRRDLGKCARCQSVRNLEFDHIIPMSKGGSNTTRNIQLLCETCNRQKSNDIG